MFDITITGKLALFVALPTTFVLLYLLLRRTDVRQRILRRWNLTMDRFLSVGQKLKKDDEEDDTTTKTRSSRQSVIELKVPSYAVSAVIGEEGTTIKKIEKTSRARIEYIENEAIYEEDEKTLSIQGERKAVQKAELMIRSIIADVPYITSEDIYVPNSCTAFLIGKNTKTLQTIKRVSGAEVVFERVNIRDPTYMRLVTLTGTREQNEHAKKMINLKIDEFETFQTTSDSVIPLVDDLLATTETSPEREKWDNESEVELPPLGSQRRDVLELMVVSAENPGHFWGHICNENLPKLLKLQNELEAFYGKSTETEACRISEAAKNDIVAVCLDNGTKWFRARITEVLDDGYQVFCVDYGYHEVVSKCDIRKLCGSFLSLPFQALECYLANVKPTENENWSKLATDTFENLVCMNQSKVISGDIIRYQRTSHGLVPCLKLIDYNGPQVSWCNLWLRATPKHLPDKGTVNINEELVQMGHAEWDEASESEQIFKDDFSADMSQKVLTCEGSGSSESLTDPFLKFPPEEKQKVSSPPTDAEWADDFPYAWAYNEEESTARGDVCEMQPCLSDKHSPIGEITQAGAGDIISLQETNTFTKQTSESSYLTTTTGYDEENHALKTDDTKDLSGSLFYNGICSDVDKGLPASPNSPPICHPDGYSVGVPESNLYSFSAEDTHIDRADDNSSLSICQVDSEMTQMSDVDTVTDQHGWSPSNSEISLDKSDITRLGSPQDDSGIFCSSIAVSAKAEDSTSEFSGMDISREEDSSAVVSLQEDRTADFPAVTVPGRDESVLEGLNESGDSVSISQDTSTLICESEELDENELKGRVGLYSNMGTKEDKEEGKDVSGRDPNVFIDINRSGENLEQESALPCSPQPHLGEQDQFSSESSKIVKASEQSANQLLPETEATVSGSAQISSTTGLGASQIVQSTRSQSEEHDQCVLGMTDIDTKTCDLKTDTINLSDVTTELTTQTVSDTSETLTHDYHYLSETESHKADEISEITDTESCEKLKESGFFSVVPGPCLNDESSSTLDYSQTEPLDVLIPSTTTDISPEPCPTILDPPQIIPLPPTNILDQAISNVELASSLDSASEVCDVLPEIDIVDSDLASDLHTRFAEKEINLIQVEEILSSDSKRELSPEVFGQAAVLTVSESKETDSSQCQFVQSLPSINRTLLDKWAMLYSPLEEDDDWKEKTKLPIGQTNQRPKTEQFSRSLETVSEPLENDTHVDDIWKFFYTPISDKERELEDARWVMSEDAEYSEYGYDEHKSWETHSDKTLLKDQGVFRDDWKDTLSEPLEDDDTDFYICSLFEYTISERKVLLSSTDDRQMIYSSEKHIQVVESIKYERDEDVREIEEGVVEERLSDSPEYEERTEEKLEGEEITDIVSTEKTTEQREMSSTEYEAGSLVESKTVPISTLKEKQNGDFEYSVLEDDEWEEGERTVIKFGEKPQDMKTFQKDWHCTESDPLEEDKEADWLSFYSPVCEDSEMIDTESLPDMGEKQDSIQYSTLEEDEWEDGERPKVTYGKEMASMKTFQENWKETASDPLEEEIEDLPDSADRTLAKPKTVPVTIESEKQEIDTEYSTLEDDEWEEGERTGFKTLGERSLTGKTFQENWKDTKSDSLEVEVGDWLSFYSSVIEDPDNVDPESLPDVGEKHTLVKYSGMEEDEWEEGERPKVMYSKKMISVKTFQENWKETASDPLEEEIEDLPDSTDRTLVKPKTVLVTIESEKQSTDLEYSTLEDDEWEEGERTGFNNLGERSFTGKTFQENWKDTKSDSLEGEMGDWLSFYSPVNEDPDNIDPESLPDVGEKHTLVKYSGMEEDEWEEGERPKIQYNKEETSQKHWKETVSDSFETEGDWLSFYSPNVEDTHSVESELVKDTLTTDKIEELSDVKQRDLTEDEETHKDLTSMKEDKTETDNLEEDWLSYYSAQSTDDDDAEMVDAESHLDSTEQSRLVAVSVPGEKQNGDLEYSVLEDDEWEEGERTVIKFGEKPQDMKTFQKDWHCTESDPLEEDKEADWLSFYSPVCEDSEMIDTESLPDMGEKQDSIQYSTLEEDEWEDGERPKVTYGKEMASMKTFQENWKETASDPLEEEIEDLPDSADRTLVKPKSVPVTIESEKQEIDTEYSTLEDDEWEEGERTGFKTLGERLVPEKTFQENWKDTKSDSLEGEMCDWISFYSPVSEYLHVSEFGTISDASVIDWVVEHSNLDDDHDDWEAGERPVVKSDPTECPPMETFQKDWKETVSDPLDQEIDDFSLVNNNQFEETLSSQLEEKSPISMEDSKDKTLRSSSERDYPDDTLISTEDSKDETLRSSSERDYPDDKSMDTKEKSPISMEDSKGKTLRSSSERYYLDDTLIYTEDSKDETLRSSSERDYPDDKSEDKKEPDNLGDLVSVSQQDGEGSAKELPHVHYQKSSSIEDSMSESDGSFEGQEYEGSDEMHSNSEHFSSEDDETPIVDLTELTMVSDQTEPGYSSSKSDYMSEESEEEDYDADNFTASDSQSSGEEIFPETGLVECDKEHQVSGDSDQEVAAPSSPESEFSLDEAKPCQKTELPVAESETILSDHSEQSGDDQSPFEQDSEEEKGKEVLDTEMISHSSLEIKTEEVDDDYNLGDDSCKDMEPILDVDRKDSRSSSETLKTLDVSESGIASCEKIQLEIKDEETLDDQVSTISEETGISLGETQVEDVEMISVRSRSQSSSRSWTEGEQSAGVHISQPDTDLPEDFENVYQSGEIQTADLDQATSDDSLQIKESIESCEKEGFEQEESSIKLDDNEFKQDNDTTEVGQEPMKTPAEKNFQEGWKETQSDPLEEGEANWLSFYSPGTEDLDLVENVSETNETQDAWSVYPTQYEEEILGDISDKEDVEFVDAVEEQTELWYPALTTFSLDSYDEKYEGSVQIKETDEDIGIYVDDNEDGSIKPKRLVLDDPKVCRETFLADWRETVSEPLEEGPGYSGIEWRSDVMIDIKGEHYEHPSNYSSLYEDSEWEEKILTSHHPVSKQVEVKMFEMNWKETVSDPLDEDEDSPFDFLQREDGIYCKPEREVVLDVDEERTIGSELQEDNQFSDECQTESSVNEEFDECRVSDEISSESRKGGITTEESADISMSLEMSALDADTKETADSKDVYVAEKHIQVVEDITYLKSVDKVVDLDINLQYSTLEEDEWEERDEHAVMVSIYPQMPVETCRKDWKETESDPLEEDKEADWLSFYSPVCEDSEMIDTESLPDVGEKQDSIQYSTLEEDEWEDGERPKVTYGKEMASMKTFQENWKETASDPLEEEIEDLPDSADRTLAKPKSVPVTIESEKQEIDTEYSTLEDDEWEEGERTGFKTLGERSLTGKTFQENWKDTKSDSLEGEMGDWLSFYSPVNEDPDNIDPESLPDVGEKHTLVKYSGMEEDEWEEGERPKIPYNKEETSQKHWKETVSDSFETEGDWLSFYSPNVEDTHSVESELVKDTLTTDEVEIPNVKQGDLSEDEEIYKDLTSMNEEKKDTMTDTGEEEDWLSYYSAQSTDVEDAEMVDAESQNDSTEQSKLIPVSVPGEKQNGDLEYSVLEDDEWEEGERTVIKFGEKPQDMKTFQKDWHCTESDPLEEDKEADWLSFYSPVCEDSEMIDTESLPDMGEKQDSIQYSTLEEDEWEDGGRSKVTYGKEMASMKTFQENWKETASDPLEEEIEDLPDSADRTLVKPKSVPVTIESEKQEIDTEYSTLEDDEWEEGERTGFKTPVTDFSPGKTFQENWKDTKSDSLEGDMGDWLSFYSPVNEDLDNVDPESLPDVREKQELVKYSGMEEDEWEEGERPKIQYNKEEISQKDLKETASELLEPDLCTLSSPESPGFYSETTISDTLNEGTNDVQPLATVSSIDQDVNVCDILEEETSSASKAVNTDDKDVWGMYFTSLDEDNDEWNERNEEFSSGISKAVDRSEDFSWEIREQIAQSLPQQSKSASYQSQPKFFSSSLESWVSSGTGTLVTATPGDMSTPALSEDDDTEYIDAQDSFQDEEVVSDETEPHDVNRFQGEEEEEKVREETDCHDVAVEQNLSNGSAVRGDTTANLDPEALSRRQFIEEEISLLLCEIVAMATEETKSTEKRKLSEQDIKEESSKISQQITELIHGMVNSNEGVEKSSEEYKGPQVLNIATQDVDEMAAFTEVVPQEETYSDELVLTPRESELKSCNLHVTQQMEEKLQNIATLYSNYAEEIPDTQLMLKLETLYFIEKLGKDKQKPSPPENLPSLEATSAAGTGITGPSVEAVESNESLDSHSRSAVPEIPPDTNEQQLDLGQVETASKSPVSENDEIFANVLMVELPSAEELSVSGEVSSFDASVHECETQRFTSILEVSLPEGPTNENRELTPCKIVPESKKFKLKKKRLSPGDRIARRWRKKSPYRNYSNALFVNIPSFEESSNVEFWKKMSRTCVEPNSDLEDFQKGKKMIQRRISEAGFPIETQSELLLRIPPHESDTWESKFRCSLHTFVSDYDQKHFHNVFVIPKRHEKYSAEVNMDLNRRILAGGTKKGYSVTSRVSEDSTERACSPDSTICALSSSCASGNENVTQRKTSIQEKTTIILHDKAETKEKESERKNSVVIDFATSDASNDKMSYFTEDQIQDLLRKITQEASVSHYSKTAIYNDSHNFENNYRYGTNGSHLGLMDYRSSGEIYYDAKSEPDKTMLSTYSEMLLSSNIVSPETVEEEEMEPDSQVRAGSTDSEGYMTAEEKSESELQMTQTSERLAKDLSSLLSVDSAELSRELSQSYTCDQPNFTEEQSISTSSSDSDGDYPAGQHLILEFGLEKESRKSEANDPSSQLEIGTASSELSVAEVEPRSELSVAEVEPRSEPSLEPVSSFVEPVSAEAKSSEHLSLEADSSKPKEIPTIHMTVTENESQDKVCKEHHVKEKTVMEVSLFGEKHMVSSTDELKILVESHDLNIEDFSNIKLSPSSQLDCFSELSFGGASSVDLDELLHQKNLILEVHTTHESSSSQQEKQKESVSSCVDRTEEFSLIDLPQQIEKSISEYCRQSRKSLTDGTCLPLHDEFPFGIGKPDSEQQVPSEVERTAEPEMVVTGSGFDLPVIEDSEDKAEIIKDSTLAAIVDNVLFESEDSREETDSKISPSVKDENESNGTSFAAMVKGKKKKKKKSKFFALDNEVLMSFRDAVDVTKTEEEEGTKSIDKAQMLFEQVDSSVKSEERASKLPEMQDTSSKDDKHTDNIYHPDMKELEIYEFKAIDIPENSTLEANRVLIDSKELDKTEAESGKNFLVDQIEVSLSDQALLMTSNLDLTQEIAEMNINQGSVLAETEVKPYEDTQVDQVEVSLSDQPPTLLMASDLELTEENAEMTINQEPAIAEVTSYEDSQVDQLELNISVEAHPITSELELDQETAEMNINQGSNLGETEFQSYENSQIDPIELPLSEQALLMTSDLGLTHETAEMNINQGSVLAETEVKPYEDTQVDQVEVSLSDQPPTLLMATDLELTEENAEMTINQEPAVAEVTSYEDSQVDQLELNISVEAHPITSELELDQETAEMNINQGPNTAETEFKPFETSQVDQIELPLSDQALLMTSDLSLTHETAEMNINQGSVLAETEVKPYEDTQVDQVEVSLSDQPPPLLMASDLELTEENAEMTINQEPAIAEVTSYEDSQADQLELNISVEAHPITSELELDQETAEMNINQGPILAETEFKPFETSQVGQIELPLSDQALLMTSDLGLTHKTAEMNINQGLVLAETEVRPYEDTQVDQIDVPLSDQAPPLLMASDLELTEESTEMTMTMTQGPVVAEINSYENYRVDQIELSLSGEDFLMATDIEETEETEELNIKQGPVLSETEVKLYEHSQVDQIELPLSEQALLMTSDLGLIQETAVMNINQGLVLAETEIKSCEKFQVDQIEVSLSDQALLMTSELESAQEESIEYNTERHVLCETETQLTTSVISTFDDHPTESNDLFPNHCQDSQEMQSTLPSDNMVSAEPVYTQDDYLAFEQQTVTQPAEPVLQSSAVEIDTDTSTVEPAQIFKLTSTGHDQHLISQDTEYITVSETSSTSQQTFEGHAERIADEKVKKKKKKKKSPFLYGNSEESIRSPHFREYLITDSDNESGNKNSVERDIVDTENRLQTMTECSEICVPEAPKYVTEMIDVTPADEDVTLVTSIEKQDMADIKPVDKKVTAGIDIGECVTDVTSAVKDTTDAIFVGKDVTDVTPIDKDMADATHADRDVASITPADKDAITMPDVTSVDKEVIKDKSVDREVFKAKSIDREVSKAKSVEKEMSKAKSVEKEVSKAKSIEKEASKAKSVEKEVSKAKSIEKEASKAKSVEKEVSKAKSVEKEASKAKSVEKEVSKAKSVEKEVADVTSIEKEVSKAKSVEKEASKAKSVEKEVSKAKSVEKEVSKGKSVEKEVSKAKSVEKEVADVTSVEKEVSKAKSVEKEASKAKSVEKEVSKAKSVEKEVSKAKSVEKEVSKAKSVEKEVSKGKSVEKEVSKAKSIEKEVADVTSVEKEVSKAKSVEKEASKAKSVEKEVSKAKSVEKEVSKAKSVEKEVSKAKSVEKEVADVTSVDKEVTDVTPVDKEVTDVTPIDKSETEISAKKGKKEAKESSKKKDSSEKRKRSRSSKSAEKEIYKERSKSPYVGDAKQTTLKESVDAPLAETSKDSEKPSDVAMELFGKDSKKKKKRKKSSLRESPETSKSTGEKSASEKVRQSTPFKTFPTSEQSVSEEIKEIAHTEKSSEMVKTKKEIAGSKVTRSEECHSSFLFETTYSSVDRQLSSEEELQREFSLEPSDDRTDESIYNLLPSETEIDVRTDKASIQEELKGEFTTEEMPRIKTVDTVLDPSLQEKDKVVKAVEKKREASVKKSLLSKTSSSESNTSVKTSTTVTEKIVSIKSETERASQSSTKTKNSEASEPSKSKSRDAKTKSAERKKKTEKLEKTNTQPFSVEVPVVTPATFADESKRQNLEQQQQPLDEAVKTVPSYQRESSLSESESPRIKLKQKEQKKKRRRSPFPYGDGNKSLLSRGIEQFLQTEDEIPKSAGAEKGSPCPAKTKTDGIIPEPFVSVEPTHLVETTKLENLPKKDHQRHVVTTKISKDKSHKKEEINKEEMVTKKPFEDFAGDLPKEERQPQVATTKISKEKSHKKVNEDVTTKKPFESMAGDLPKETRQPQVVTTKVTKEKSHKNVHEEEATKKSFESMAGDYPKEKCQSQVVTTKEKSHKNVHEEEAMKKPVEDLSGDLLKEDHQSQVVTTTIYSKEISLKNVHEEEATKRSVECLVGDLLKEEHQPQVVMTTVPKEKSHKIVQETKEAIFDVPSPCSYVVKDSFTETSTKEVTSKQTSQLSTKISESRVSQALSKVSSLISKKTSSSASENGSPKHKSLSSSSEENINPSPPLSQASDSSSSLNLGLLRLSTKKKQKKVDSMESVTASEKTTTKAFTADTQDTSESSREDLSTKIISTPNKEVSPPDSSSETVLGSPVKKEKQEVPKITKSVVEKISSLVTSITKQVTESFEELSTHKKKKLKQSIISEKEAQDRQNENEELGRTLKQKLYSKTKSNKSSSEDRSKSRTRSKAVFAGSQLLSVQQSARKTPSPVVSRKKGQKQQSSTRRDRQNIPFSTITIESPRREHTYLPLINHLTEEEAAFSDTTPQIKRKKKSKRKERNLSQLSTATESSCEIDTVLWSSFHKRSTQDLSVKKKTRVTQPRITISEDRDYWPSSTVNSPDVIRKELTPIQYLSSDNLSHTRSRSRSHRSPAKELLWLSEQELNLTLSDGHETNTTRRVRSQSHINRFSKINLAYISTGTRKRKRRKKNIVAV